MDKEKKKKRDEFLDRLQGELTSFCEEQYKRARAKFPDNPMINETMLRQKKSEIKERVSRLKQELELTGN